MTGLRAVLPATDLHHRLPVPRRCVNRHDEDAEKDNKLTGAALACDLRVERALPADFLFSRAFSARDKA